MHACTCACVCICTGNDSHQVLAQNTFQNDEVSLWQLCQCLEENLGCYLFVDPGRSELVQVEQGKVGLKVVAVAFTLEADVLL